MTINVSLKWNTITKGGKLIKNVYYRNQFFNGIMGENVETIEFLFTSFV